MAYCTSLAPTGAAGAADEKDEEDEDAAEEAEEADAAGGEEFVDGELTTPPLAVVEKDATYSSTS